MGGSNPIQRPITLWLIEDEPRFSRPFARLVESTSEFVLTGSFSDYESALRALEGAWALSTKRAPQVGHPIDDIDSVDVVVMDLQLPGIDGIEATRDIRTRMDGVAVVVLTSADDPESIFRALHAGASGYVIKGSPADDILTALRDAHRGGTYFPPGVAKHVLSHFTPQLHPDQEPLSEREKEVVELLAEGRSKARIAEALFLSPHTVDSHLRNVYAKLHARSATEAVAKALRQRLI